MKDVRFCKEDRDKENVKIMYSKLLRDIGDILRDLVFR